MQQPVSPAPPFEPLPLRSRGVLELIDITIKIFRRYFWVLAGWSLAVVGGSSGVAAIGMLLGAIGAGGESFSWVDFAGTAFVSLIFGALIALFLWPLILGAAACCIAAAVRGQSVTFKQCWQFTKPRYGQILGLFLASLTITWIALMGYMVLCGLIIGLGALALQSVPSQVSGVLAVIAFVSFYVIGIVLGLVIATWMFMVPMVPCLEGQMPSSGPLRRAWDLLRGQWRRALGLMFLLGVCLMALSFIMQAVAGVFGLFSGGAASWQTFTNFSEGVSLVVYMALNTLTSVVTTPFMFLLIAMFYLDLRIRKEALDLEWSAHVTSPGENTSSAAQVNTAPQLESFGQPSAGATPGIRTPNFEARSDASFSMPQQAAPSAVTRPLSDNAWSTTPNEVPPDVASTQILQPDAAPAKVPANVEPVVAWSAHQPAEPVITNIAAPSEALPSQAVPSQAVPSQDTTATNATATCPQCNAAVRKDQTFCMQCGARLTTSSSTFGSPLE